MESKDEGENKTGSSHSTELSHNATSRVEIPTTTTTSTGPTLSIAKQYAPTEVEDFPETDQSDLFFFQQKDIAPFLHE